MQVLQVPVLIVGGGPVGMLGAIMLAQRGLPCLGAENHPHRLDAPKAHALNPRSLQICAAAVLSMDALHAAATPRHEGACVRMVTSLVGAQIGCLPYERQDEDVSALTPWPLINISQPAFEHVLEQVLTQTEQVTLRKGLEWRGCEQQQDQVISTLIDRESGEPVQVVSRYLIAADGASSTVREHLGIPMLGPQALQHNMMVHFEADLRELLHERPAILYFLFGPGSSRVLIAYDIGKTWVLMHRCDEHETVADFGPEVCLQLIHQAIGSDKPHIQIKHVRPWVMSAQVAQRYAQGRVFLAGDAGHRFPPSGGLGLNTGVADIDNLTWKLAAVDKGMADPSLLDTYESERQGIAQTNMRQSLSNAQRMKVLMDVLGYHPDAPDTAEQITQRLTDAHGQKEIEEAVEYQREHFDSLRLQLGYAYGGTLQQDDALPISEFRPQAVAGARLPHHPLADGRSTLDLVHFSEMALLCGHESPWTTHSHRLGLFVHCMAQGRDYDMRGHFPDLMGLSVSGALLVRPDGHILAVAQAFSEDELQHLQDALQTYLHLSPISINATNSTPECTP
jgi:2-polyprenyl-6-methoxyphenol hydroxylase-like FAD-dependent oxidoreductase